MVDANDIILWTSAFIALWWLFDWIHGLQEGERLPMRRAPLRVLGDVLPKLWRNKSFMLALLSLWLIGATVAGVQGYLLQVSPELAGVEAPGSPDASFSMTDSIPQMIGNELSGALPRVVEIPLGNWAAILIAALLIAAMVRIIIDPPEQIGKEIARKLRWPAGLLVLGLAASIGMIAAPREFMESFSYGGGVAPPRTILWTIGTMTILPALLAAVFALLWRLVLEIARGGVWSFVSSIRALANAWLPITLLLLLANALRPAATLVGADYQEIWGYGHLAVLVLLVLAPWAMLDQQNGFLAALKRSWRLIRLKPVDALAFGLRFTLLFAVLGGLVALAEPPATAVWAAWYAPLLDVVRNALLLLQALVLARFYVHLSEMLDEDEACATCPSARMGERLEEQAEEE